MIEIAPPSARPSHSALSVGAVSWKRESAKVGSRNFSRMSDTPGIDTTPPTIESSASGAIAAFIGQACSATKCSGPGKPTSVSSASPVIGFTGSPCARWPASSSRASATGSPKNTRNTIRKA